MQQVCMILGTGDNSREEVRKSLPSWGFDSSGRKRERERDRDRDRTQIKPMTKTAYSRW